MKPIGKGELSSASILSSLHHIFPYYGSSFYAKGKLVKKKPPQNMATVIIDVIRQCSFGCEFCFASRTQKQKDYTSLKKLKPILADLKGIAKIGLIGGEPFEHPEIYHLIEEIGKTVTTEIEIFTNGNILVKSFDELKVCVKNLKQTGICLRLTLAADNWHKSRHGEKQFEIVISKLLQLEQENLLAPMFNVTDQRISSDGYISLPTIKETLKDISPKLWQHFKTLLKEQRVDEGFYLNPLIIQGRQKEHQQAENLRVVDFMYHKEVIISERENELILLSSLNACWMEQIPDDLFLGVITDNNMPKILLEKVVGKQLDFEQNAILKDKFISYAKSDHADHSSISGLDELQAVKLVSDFNCFMLDEEKYYDNLANKIVSIAMQAKKAGTNFDLSGRPDFDKLRLPVLCLVLKKLAAKGFKHDLFESSKRFWQTLLDNEFSCPILLTDSQNLYNTNNKQTAPVPLALVSLDSGFALLPDLEAKYAARIKLLIRHDDTIDCSFHNLTISKTHNQQAEIEDSVLRLLYFWDHLFGDLSQELRQNLKAMTTDSNNWHAFLSNILASPKPSTDHSNTLKNLTDIFKYITFDPNKNEAAYSNHLLLQSIIDSEDFPRYASTDVLNFKSSLKFWLDRSIK